MNDRSWRWYLLGDEGKRPHKEEKTSNNSNAPPANVSKCNSPFQPVSRPSAAEEEHYKAEKSYWDRQVGVAVGLNWITACGAIVAVLGILVVYLGVLSTDTATIEANRAWLGIARTEFTRGIDDPNGPSITVYVKNTGRTPATDVRTGGTWAVMPLSAPWIKENELPISDYWGQLDRDIKSQCRGVKPLIGSSSIFPFADNGTQSELAAPKPIPDMGSVKNYTAIIIAPGCLTYVSFRKVRHTGFCQFASNLRTPPAWDWLNCPAGNFAE